MYSHWKQNSGDRNYVSIVECMSTLIIYDKFHILIKGN